MSGPPGYNRPVLGDVRIPALGGDESVAEAIEALRTEEATTGTGAAGTAGATGPVGPEGPVGPQGQGFNFRQGWTAATAYNPYDVITYAGSAYVATTAFTSGQTFSTAGLSLMAAAGAVGGIGALSAVPAGGTNGTPLGTPPSAMSGVRFYLPPNSSVTYAVAPAQPSAAPSPTFTTPVSSVASNWDEPLSGQIIYVTAITGSPLFRWL